MIDAEESNKLMTNIVFVWLHVFSIATEVEASQS